MDIVALNNIKVNLLVKGADWDLVLNLLNVLKKKNMVEFEIEDKPDPELEQSGWTKKELNAIIEEAEKQESISFEDFFAKCGL